MLGSRRLPAPPPAVLPFLLAALLVLLPAVSRATMLLDQVANPDGGSFTEGVDLRGYESFAVGVSGQLSEIDLWAIDPGISDGYLDSSITISDTFAPAPGPFAPDDGFTDLANGTVPFPNNYQGNGDLTAGWVRFILTNPLPVTAGEVLYFSLDAGPYGPVWATSAYGAGSLEFICFYDYCGDPFTGQSVPGGWISASNAHVAFRTYVNTPEPGLSVLLALCAVALRGPGRRRRT